MENNTFLIEFLENVLLHSPTTFFSVCESNQLQSHRFVWQIFIVSCLAFQRELLNFKMKQKRAGSVWYAPRKCYNSTDADVITVTSPLSKIHQLPERSLDDE